MMISSSSSSTPALPLPSDDEHQAPPQQQQQHEDKSTSTTSSSSPLSSSSSLQQQQQNDSNDKNNQQQQKQRKRRRLWILVVLLLILLCAVIIGVVVYFTTTKDSNNNNNKSSSSVNNNNDQTLNDENNDNNNNIVPKTTTTTANPSSSLSLSLSPQPISISEPTLLPTIKTSLPTKTTTTSIPSVSPSSKEATTSPTNGNPTTIPTTNLPTITSSSSSTEIITTEKPSSSSSSSVASSSSPAPTTTTVTNNKTTRTILWSSNINLDTNMYGNQFFSGLQMNGNLVTRNGTSTTAKGDFVWKSNSGNDDFKGDYFMTLNNDGVSVSVYRGNVDQVNNGITASDSLVEVWTTGHNPTTDNSNSNANSPFTTSTNDSTIIIPLLKSGQFVNSGDDPNLWWQPLLSTGLLQENNGNFIIYQQEQPPPPPPPPPPSVVVTSSPSANADITTNTPTEKPTEDEPPTDKPTDEPTEKPTDSPTIAPTMNPTVAPTVSPTESPINITDNPTIQPSKALVSTSRPTATSPAPTETLPTTMFPTTTVTDASNGDDVEILYRPGDLTVEENGLLLSTGLTSRIIAKSGDKVKYTTGKSSKEKFHYLPDMGGTFDISSNDPTNPNGWIYVSNSEVRDLGMGGVGSITFDKDDNIIDYKMVLTNTTSNCGGGRTPWNTWVSCEELMPQGESGIGQIYQVDPTGRRVSEITSMGLDGGRFESFTYDVRNKSKPRFYASEDRRRGALRRYTPSTEEIDWDDNPWSMLHGNNGVLDYLVLTPNNPSNELSSGTFDWVSDLKTSQLNAAEYYPESEGIDVADGFLYLICKRIKVLTVLDLDNMKYKRFSTVSGVFDGSPDQVARILSSTNNNDNNVDDILYFTEEGGERAGVHGRNAQGQYFTILEGVDYKDETTGLSFTSNGKHLIVAYQKTGLLFDITRIDGLPFYGQTLNVNYHNINFDLNE